MNKPAKSQIIPYIAAVGTILFWSSAFPAVRYTLQHYSPEALMIFRFLIASALLLVYCAVRRVPMPKLRDMPLFATSGLVGVFLYMWVFNTGAATVQSGISSFIISSAPVFTLIMSIVFLKEKASATIWIGVLVSFAGIGIIAAATITELQLSTGVWLLLGAAVCTSAFNIIQKRITQSYTPMQATAYCIVFGTIPMLIFLPALIGEFPYAPASVNIAVVYLGVFPAALAYFLWGFALAKADKTIYVTSFSYLSPFLASIMAFIWLGETISPVALIGGVVVIAGMVITNVLRRRPSSLR